MEWLTDLRPIRFFSLYLALIFCLSTWVRLRQYRDVLSLVTRLHSRWPNLTRLVLAHRHIFLTWNNLRPLVLVGMLLVVNTTASHFVWPEAQDFKVADMLVIWPVLPVVVAAAGCMIVFDVTGLVRVGEINHAEAEKYFDLAESWLTGWRAPAVRVFTLGYVNPRQMVAKEVGAALEGASALLNTTLWWVSTQAGLRIACGLALWGSYALQDVVRRCLGVG
jgi:hypothetical protein